VCGDAPTDVTEGLAKEILTAGFNTSQVERRIKATTEIKSIENSYSF